MRPYRFLRWEDCWCSARCRLRFSNFERCLLGSGVLADTRNHHGGGTLIDIVRESHRVVRALNQVLSPSVTVNDGLIAEPVYV